MRSHDRLFHLLLALIAVSAAAVAFGHSVFSASVSDTSGYVAAAESLRVGRLFRPSPLQLIPAIQGSGASTSPLGFSPGVVSGTEVPVYPLGLPYLMAGFASIFGPLAAYAVTPAALGMLVILAGVLAKQTGGNAAGIAAALFVALDPVGILNGVVSAVDARAEYRFAFDESFLHSRILSMGSYLQHVLPRNAAVVAYIHSGAIVHYAGKRTLGPEGLQGAALDRLVADLRSYGQHPVLVLDENVEVPAFKRLFADSEFGALDWPPRAQFVSATTILYFDFADRARFRRGDRWPIDVVGVSTRLMSR